MARSRLLLVAFRMAVISSCVSRFSGVTFGFFSFMARLIQFTSGGMGVPLAHVPCLAYCTIFRSKSLLSALVDSLFGLLFIWATMCSISVFVIALMSAPFIMRNRTGMCALHLDILPNESPSALRWSRNCRPIVPFGSCFMLWRFRFIRWA